MKTAIKSSDYRLGVDWSTDELCMVCLKRCHTDFELHAYAIETIRSGSTHTLALQQALRLAWQYCNLQSQLLPRRVVFALPAVELKISSLGLMPRLSSWRSRASVWKALQSQTYDFNSDTYGYYDIIYVPQSHNQHSVYVVHAPIHLLQQRCKLLSAIGLSAHAVDIDIFSKLRTLSLDPDFKSNMSLTQCLAESDWIETLNDYYQQHKRYDTLIHLNNTSGSSVSDSDQQKLVMACGLAMHGF